MLAHICTDMRTNVRIRDRAHAYTIVNRQPYACCFLGSEAVDWLQHSRYCRYVFLTKL
jgi:hypothetical protein